MLLSHFEIKVLETKTKHIFYSVKLFLEGRCAGRKIASTEEENESEQEPRLRRRARFQMGELHAHVAVEKTAICVLTIHYNYIP